MCNHLEANANPEGTIPVKQDCNHFGADKNPKSIIPAKQACNHLQSLGGKCKTLKPQFL
jgi:hypothetical protein